MPTLTEKGAETINAQDWNNFFDGPEKKKLAETSQLDRRVSYCASWVNDQSFEINRVDEHDQSEIRKEFESSPLSKNAESYKDMQKKSKRSKSGKLKEPVEKRQKPDSTSTPLKSVIKNVNFFESIARATREIRKSANGPSKWRVVDGIYVENDSDTTRSSTPKTAYEELMSVFRKRVKINDGINFEHTYPFDWNHFEKYGMQYVVFTKVCQSHPPGYFIEMKKEETVCKECGGSDLALTIRLTIPLSLSEVQIPADLNLGIYVAFLVSKLPNFDKLTLETGMLDFTRETTERMYKLYRQVLLGKPSDEYSKWFERCHRFAKDSLFSKRLRLFHGRVIRRKFEEVEHFTKRRCFIFADLFDLE